MKTVKSEGSLLKIGVPGRKYGLQPPKQTVKPTLAVFTVDDDEEDNDKQATDMNTIRRKKIERERKEIMQVDPTIYQYDEHLDQIEEKRKEKVKEREQEQSMRQQPKYIAQLLKAAEARNIESEINYERLLLKERQREDAMYENSDVFVTSGFKDALKKRKEFLAVQDKKDAALEQGTIGAKGTMGSFFANNLAQLTRSKAFEEEEEEKDKKKKESDIEEARLVQKAKEEAWIKERDELERKREQRKQNTSESSEATAGAPAEDSAGTPAERKLKPPPPPPPTVVKEDQEERARNEKKKKAEEEENRKDKAGDARSRFLARKKQKLAQPEPSEEEA